MLKYLLKRIGQGVITLWVLVTLTFFLVRAMPGSPYTEEKAIPAHVLARIKAYAGLDQPLWVQYGKYLSNLVLKQDLGDMIRKDGVRVSEIIGESFQVSLVLGVSAFAIAVMIGIPAGVWAAVKKNTWIDFASLTVAMVGICLPSFVIGPLLAVGIGMHLTTINVAGWNTWSDCLLPALTLGFINAAYLARLTRGGMLEVLSQDYIRTAKAKGLAPYQIILKHALRGGLISSIAFLGPAFAGMISGSFVIETIFQVPGMGQHFVNAATDREFFLIQGLVLFYGFLIVTANLCADLLQVLLNPRVSIS